MKKVPKSTKSSECNLISKYAESYLTKEKENSELKKQIEDMSETIKHNKIMIATILNEDYNLDFKVKEITEKCLLNIENKESTIKELYLKISKIQEDVSKY